MKPTSQTVTAFHTEKRKEKNEVLLGNIQQAQANTTILLLGKVLFQTREQNALARSFYVSMFVHSNA